MSAASPPNIRLLDLHADEQIKAYVAHSWYDYSVGKDQGLHPYKGETTLHYSEIRTQARHPAGLPRAKNRPSAQLR